MTSPGVSPTSWGVATSGNVAAFHYPRGAVPSEDTMLADLDFLLTTLAGLYAHLDGALSAPGNRLLRS
ncbi:hypothetical protein CLV40_12165 [Actinokineospora auranticolor]|uniref:Uncharacterized protein n=1 Tax=Actinokineospora auranticolor TaxID=155976 RepID=A0A2S6GG74_9PSEU|nr:hypothetical protein CLV40_12165 [Actinokineospora auranticolor]